MILGLLEGISGQKMKEFHSSSCATLRSILVDIKPYVSRIQHKAQTIIAEKTFLKAFKNSYQICKNKQVSNCF